MHRRNGTTFTNTINSVNENGLIEPSIPLVNERFILRIKNTQFPYRVESRRLLGLFAGLLPETKKTLQND
jgi:hypothetical protein